MNLLNFAQFGSTGSTKIQFQQTSLLIPEQNSFSGWKVPPENVADIQGIHRQPLET